MRYADALKMADDCMTYRITVKEYAMKYGWHATFMPKPMFGENGSGMHTHQSLFRDSTNAFYDPDDQYFLSDVGKAFIAGQLKHAREICSIFAQWVNSYKRLVPGFEAPVYVAWSRRNRSALVRVPLYHPGREKATRMELRCPDPACNPYLTFAALLQAGLEGIEKGYELPEPMEKNLYHLSGEERKRLGVEQLPESLGEAIEITAESELVLRTLGEHMFNRYVEIKRQEWEDYRVQVTQLGARPLPVDPVGTGDRAGDRAHRGEVPVHRLQRVGERGRVARRDVTQQREHRDRVALILALARQLGQAQQADRGARRRPRGWGCPQAPCVARSGLRRPRRSRRSRRARDRRSGRSSRRRARWPA